MPKENVYDEASFFKEYAHMPRSEQGLDGAGEWHELRKLLPDFSGRRVLDLGCGFGWHCRYATEHGAAQVLGIDLSENMLTVAREKNADPRIEYRQMAIEDFAYPENAYDVVISSLALHYVDSFAEVCGKVARCLTPGGDFVFSVEHPIFTAYGTQDWIYSDAGEPLFWPVDRYFTEGMRTAVFLGHTVEKQHKTLTTYLNEPLLHGLTITRVVEPRPDDRMMNMPGMADELRRPMMLLVAAKKLPAPV